MYQSDNPALLTRRCASRVLIILVSGCASLPTDYPRTESMAMQDYQFTSMGQGFAAAEAEHPGESGFTIIRYGRNAFSTRIAMSDLAEKTLDLQSVL